MSTGGATGRAAGAERAGLAGGTATAGHPESAAHADHAGLVGHAERADSAGQTWSGRGLAPGAFAGDDGTGDPVLRAALARATEPVAEVQEQAAEALSQARLLIPVVAAPDDHGTPARAEMVTPHLRRPDGATALLAFTGVDALTAYDPGARPVPVTAVQAAEAALSEQAVLLVDHDAGGAVEVPTDVLVAVLDGARWVHPARDAAVRARLREHCRGVVPPFQGWQAVAGPGWGAVRLVLLAPDATSGPPATTAAPAGQVAEASPTDSALERLSQALAADEVLRARVNGLHLAVVRTC